MYLSSITDYKETLSIIMTATLIQNLWIPTATSVHGGANVIIKHDVHVCMYMYMNNVLYMCTLYMVPIRVHVRHSSHYMYNFIIYMYSVHVHVCIY